MRERIIKLWFMKVAKHWSSPSVVHDMVLIEAFCVSVVSKVCRNNIHTVIDNTSCISTVEPNKL
jgi:hypothetical protein